MSLPPAPPYKKSKSRFLSKKLASRLEPVKKALVEGRGSWTEADHQCCLPRCPAPQAQDSPSRSTAPMLLADPERPRLNSRATSRNAFLPWFIWGSGRMAYIGTHLEELPKVCSVYSIYLMSKLVPSLLINNNSAGLFEHFSSDHKAQVLSHIIFPDWDICWVK